MNDPSTTPLNADTFRRAMGAFPTGVAVVTARDAGGGPVGLTVNSLTSVSLDPLLLLVCIDHGSASHAAIVESGAFVVNLLQAADQELSNRFAGKDRAARFEGLAWHDSAGGTPVFDEALAWFDCRVHQTHVAGDHTIVVGRVEACGTRAAEPLVYHRGRYARLAAE